MMMMMMMISFMIDMTQTISNSQYFLAERMDKIKTGSKCDNQMTIS